MGAALWPARLRLAGLAALGLGMVLVTGGVRSAALFLPGVFVLGIGFLLLASAGVAAIVSGAV